MEPSPEELDEFMEAFGAQPLRENGGLEITYSAFIGAVEVRRSTFDYLKYLVDMFHRKRAMNILLNDRESRIRSGRIQQAAMRSQWIAQNLMPQTRQRPGCGW